VGNGFDDNEQFIRQFIIETEEHLEAIESNLLELEKSINNRENFNQEPLNVLFRAIHTIKGLAGMLEFNNLFGFSHLWETMLDKLRKNKLVLSHEIIDISFEGLDFLSKFLEKIKQNRNDQGIPVENILIKLEKINQDKESKSPTVGETKHGSEITDKLSPIFAVNLAEFEKNKLISFIQKQANIYEIRVFLNKDCLDMDLSYLSTCINLEFIGEIINISPDLSNLPSLENFSPENFDLEIYILFSTDKDIEAIYKACKNRNIKITQIAFGEKEEIEETITLTETGSVENMIINETKEDISKKIFPDKNEEVILYQEKEVTSTSKPARHVSQDTIRVETARLDTLLALLGEQVISKTHLEHLSTEFIDLLKNAETEISRSKLTQIATNFNETINSFTRLSNELQEIVMHIRMLPIGNVFNRFNRVVRDLSKELGKQVELTIEGEDTELDKAIIEEISDPLIHIIRNAIDHGLETPAERIAKGKPAAGSLHFNAYQQGNSIGITIKDDGRGLNLTEIKAKALEKGLISSDKQMTNAEIINLIFEPGFSTVKEVTGISGRGVGMDVVRKNINNLKGSIDIESSENEGTNIIIKLPLTLAIIQALLVNISGNIFAVPLSSVVESYRAKPEEIISVNNKPVLQIRNKILPVLYLRDYFKLEKTVENKEFLYIVVLGISESRIAVIVDSLIGQREIVIKPLNDPLVRVKGIAGASLIGGTVTLIIDTIPLILANQAEKKIEPLGLNR
jgi:two-component system chemotaxis sensor kinase CheA